MKNFSEFLNSKATKIVLCLIGLIIIIIGLAFSVGFMAGRRRAGMSLRQTKSYSQNLNNGMMNGFRSGQNNSTTPNNLKGLSGGMMGRNGANGAQRNSGISGKIIKTDSASITIEGSNGVSSTFAITAQTAITNSQGSLKVSDLKVGDSVTVTSLPNTSGNATARSIVDNGVATNGQ